MSTGVPATGRNPFEVALLAVCLVVGLTGLVLPEPGPSQNLADTFQGWTPLVYAALLVASTGSLIGVGWPRDTGRRMQIGLSIERAALPFVAGVAGAYGTTNLVLAGTRALVAGLLVLGIALACVMRIRQITVDLRQLRQLLPPRENRWT